MFRRTLAVLAIVVLASAFVVWHRYQMDIGAARARVSSGSRVANTSCGQVEYADVGTGPVVFAIHGAGGGFDQSLDMARTFLPSGFRVVAPSRFGYLRTPFPSDSSPAAQADTHACLLDALHLQKVVVIGGSMGAPSAIQLCLRHADRCSALILLFPIAYAPPQLKGPPRRQSRVAQFMMDTTLGSDFAFWALSKLAPDTMMKSLGATPPVDVKKASHVEQARAHNIMRNIEPVSLRRLGLRSDAAESFSIPRYSLEQIAVPTLVIAAEDDLYGTFRGGQYSAQHIPGAHFVSYPTGGHLLVGHGDDVRVELTEFLKVKTSTDGPSNDAKQ